MLIALALALLAAFPRGDVPGADAGLPANFTVNTANDHAGHQSDAFLSLREAVLLATGDLTITELSGGECAQVEPASFPDACETPYLVGAPYANTIYFDPDVFPQIDPPSISAVGLFELDTFGTTIDAAGAVVTIEGTPAFPCFRIDGSSNQVRTLTITGCRDAVEMTSGSQNVIAGSALISNDEHGVLISEQSVDNTLEDNLIGTNSLDEDVGNGLSGVLLANSNGNTIKGNVIANNGSAAAASGGAGYSDDNGVTILQASGNDLDANEFRDNEGLAIDLAADGVTENDPGDLDSGPNGRQNFPVITAAIAQAPFRVEGSLDSASGIVHRLDFFENTTCDPSGNGEGGRYLGAAEIVIHAGPSDFVEFFDPAVAPGNFVTATATNLLTGDSSEFSDCFAITAPNATPAPTATPSPTPTPAPSPAPVLKHGDIDCDGDIDAIDVLKLLAHLVGSPFPQPPGCPSLDPVADIDCDGDVDAVDALQLLRFLAGLPALQQQPCPPIGEPV